MSLKLLAPAAVAMLVLTSCAPSPTAVTSTAAAPTNEPTAPAEATASVNPHARYAFPSTIDSKGRYLFYLHGKIIEDQGLPAVSPDFGEYEYEAILESLGRTGLTVISEQRGKEANPTTWARRIKDQVSALEAAGVSAEHITVVGASKGGYIAALASFVIKDPQLNFVLLGTCYPGMIEEWKGSGMTLYGNVLAIRDETDTEYSGSCEGLFARSEGKGLGRHEQLVLHVGTGHGVLFHPLDEWVGPTLEWAGQ
jgi:hypothetical protein